MKTSVRSLVLLLALACVALAPGAFAQILPFKTIAVGNGPEVDATDTVNGKVYVANFASDTVSVIDAKTWTKITDVPTGDGPRRIRFDAATNKLYVNNSNGNSVTVINMVTNAVITTINLPASSQPWNMGYNGFTSRLYVALRGTNELAVIDTTTDAVVTYVPTGMSPRVVCPNFTTNRVYVGNFSSNNVTVIDGSNNTAVAGSPVAVGTGPNGCGIDETTNRTIITNDTSGNFSVINGATNAVVATISTGGLNPSLFALNTAVNLLVIGNYNSGNVALFRLDTLAPITTITTGINPWTGFIDPTPRVLYVTNRGSNTVSVIDLYNNVVRQQIPVGTAPQGIARHFQNYYVVNQNNGGAGSVSVFKRAGFNQSSDTSNDGRSDITWANSSTKLNSLWLMNGVAPTAGAVTLGPSDWLPVVRNDLDGDGYGDIVWRNTVTNQTALWFMNGLVPRGADAGIILGPSTYVPIFTASCAGNQVRCLIWQDTVSGTVTYWYMPTGLVPTYTQFVYTGGPGWTIVNNPNFDGDFHTDLLWQHTDGRVAIWLMQGDASAGFSIKSAAVILGPGTGWVPEFTGDFDGDGRADILWRHATTGDTVIWLMDGVSMKPGGFATILPGAAGYAVTHVRDLDGDLKTDLIWRSAGGQTTGWLMDGLAIKPGGAAVLLNNPDWMVTHTLSTNGDLMGDLLWRNTVTGQTVLWTMNGLGMSGFGSLLTDPNWYVLPPE